MEEESEHQFIVVERMCTGHILFLTPGPLKPSFILIIATLVALAKLYPVSTLWLEHLHILLPSLDFYQFTMGHTCGNSHGGHICTAWKREGLKHRWLLTYGAWELLDECSSLSSLSRLFWSSFYISEVPDKTKPQLLTVVVILHLSFFFFKPF